MITLDWLTTLTACCPAGQGVFYSAENGSTVRGRWINDVLDGPCEIVLSTGKQPMYVGLSFKKNVLYGTPSPATVPSTAGRNNNNNKYGRQAVWTAGRGRPLPTGSTETAVSQFRWPCEPRPLVVPGGSKGQRPVRANVRLTNERPSACDLVGHVRKITGACAANSASRKGHNGPADLETELGNARIALEKYAGRLEEIYRAYGAFLADGPVTYRPLMTRLGLWQMLVDNRLHARVSLADFDDILCKSNAAPIVYA